MMTTATELDYGTSLMKYLVRAIVIDLSIFDGFSTAGHRSSTRVLLPVQLSFSI